MPVVAVDVAEFQPILNRTYSRGLISLRVAFGTGYQDHHFLANANAAKRLHRHGKLAGAILYGVPIFAQGTPQQHFDYWKSLIGPTCPKWVAAIMLDLETWRGATYEQHGDHSQFVNDLAKLCVDYTGGKAIIYGNQGDLAELAPHRDPHPVIVADYSTQLVVDQVPHAIGQQYTNGQNQGPAGLPLASRPFGNCDHNVFPHYPDPASLVAFLRPATAPPPAPKPKPKPRRHPWWRIHHLLCRVTHLKAVIARLRGKK